MFPWSLSCKFPCTCRESQPTSASLRGPLLPLVYGPAVGPVGKTQTLIWPNSYICMPPKSIAARARPFLFVGTLIVYSDIS